MPREANGASRRRVAVPSSSSGRSDTSGGSKVDASWEKEEVVEEEERG